MYEKLLMYNPLKLMYVFILNFIFFKLQLKAEKPNKSLSSNIGSGFDLDF